MARGMSSMCSRPGSMGRSRNRSSRSRSRSRGRCMKPGPIVRNPYLNFLRQFRKKNCGLSPVKTIQAGAKEWNRLSKEEKLEFIKEAFYAPKRRRPMSRAMCAPRSAPRRRARRRVC